VLPGVWPEVPEEPDTEPEPEAELLPLALEPWLLLDPEELLVRALELDASGVVTRGVLTELLSLELELEPELPVPPRSAWPHPTNNAAAAATGIMSFFINNQTSYFKILTPQTLMIWGGPTTQVITLEFSLSVQITA
jgi:hypothetical protein